MFVAQLVPAVTLGATLDTGVEDGTATEEAFA
jgi:hypothetical protein